MVEFLLGAIAGAVVVITVAMTLGAVVIMAVTEFLKTLAGMTPSAC
jgi:hypothetical protein